MIIAVTTKSLFSPTNVLQHSQNKAYTDYLINAGFIPIYIPKDSDVKTIAEIADGLILAGGAAISPLYYGFDVEPKPMILDPLRDNYERSLLNAFFNKRKPVLGICRGAQLIASEFLYTYPEYYKYMRLRYNIENHLQRAPRHERTHLIHVATEVLYNESLGFNTMSVNSCHRHAITLTHDHDIPNFILAGWVVEPKYKVVEAFRICDEPSDILCVQWHPEELNDLKLITNFFSGRKYENLH